jgi:hypothetical protein
MLAGAALLVIGYVLGTMNAAGPAHAAEGDQLIPVVVGVSIPAEGAAIVRGRDGKGYVVNTKGLVVPARGSGKELDL